MFGLASESFHKLNDSVYTNLSLAMTNTQFHFFQAIAMGVNPLTFMIAVTIASSLAFMLPVATPPNAIVFSTGYLKISDMVCKVLQNMYTFLSSFSLSFSFVYLSLSPLSLSLSLSLSVYPSLSLCL